MMTRHRLEAAPNERRDEVNRQPATNPEARTLAEAVGSQIRALRRTADLTTVELATRAGLSNGMLSKVERGTTMPSFDTIVRLAKGLDVPVARLFASFDDRRDISVVKAGQGLLVDRRGSKRGYSYELLGHLLSGELFVEPYLVTLQAATKEYASFQHTGVEFIHVLSGRMMYRYADRLIEVGPGDSLLYDSTAVHGPEELLMPPVKFLSICVNLRA